jgi:hypothetical protein
VDLTPGSEDIATASLRTKITGNQRWMTKAMAEMADQLVKMAEALEALELDVETSRTAAYRAGREDAARDSVIISAARDPAWTDKAAEAVLLAHLRRDIRGCLCGWAELGKSHPVHQVAMLRGAGLLGGGDQPRTVSERDGEDNPEERADG